MKTMTLQTLVLAATVVAGCGLEESSPVPQPLPGYLRRSTPSSLVSTLVVGLPGAVAGAGKVALRELGAASPVVVQSAAAGSFSAVLPVGRTTPLEIRYETADGASSWVALAPPQLSYGPVLMGSRGPGVVSAPDAAGNVTVTNDAGAGQPALVSASPDSDLLVANATRGSVVSSRTDAKGLFRVQLQGATGDEIQLLLVDAQDSAATSDYLSFTVP
jgi:hypothetical protein